MADKMSCGPVLVGICGGTGSGKTTLASRLCADLGDSALLLSMDNYYRPHYDMSFEERKKLNYDCPDAIDTELLTKQLTMLRAGEAVDVPVYSFPLHQRTADTVRTEPRTVIIVEGILLLCYPETEDLLDLSVFVDTPADLRFIRRLQRDAVERGRSTESVINQYIRTVRPMHGQYVEPCRTRADIVYSGEQDNAAAYEAILSRISELMRDR